MEQDEKSFCARPAECLRLLALVRLVWRRAHNVHVDFHLPMYFHRLQAGADPEVQSGDRGCKASHGVPRGIRRVFTTCMRATTSEGRFSGA